MPSLRNIILGSRSPRRIELLSHLVSPDRIRVLPPVDEQEAGFSGLSSLPQILTQLATIALTKNASVVSQLNTEDWGVVLTADTVVIANSKSDEPMVLGKPDGPDWKQTTRNWFEAFYSGRSHHVATGICLRSASGKLIQQQVLTEVEFIPVTPELIDWYISTREPLGKAGGYGLQGAGGLFVKAVLGSSSNVIGLPLRETWLALSQLDLLDTQVS